MVDSTRQRPTQFSPGRSSSTLPGLGLLLHAYHQTLLCICIPVLSTQKQGEKVGKKENTAAANYTYMHPPPPPQTATRPLSNRASRTTSTKGGGCPCGPAFLDYFDPVRLISELEQREGAGRSGRQGRLRRPAPPRRRWGEGLVCAILYFVSWECIAHIRLVRRLPFRLSEWACCVEPVRLYPGLVTRVRPRPAQIQYRISGLRFVSRLAKEGVACDGRLHLYSG